MPHKLAVFFLTIAFLSGCTEREEGSSAVNITSSSIVEIYSVSGQSATVNFNSSASWTVSCSADWLSFSPGKGEAGSHTLKLMTTSTNRTKSTRTAQVTITSGSTQKKITVIQGADYAVFDQERYTIGPEGGTLTLGFKSNLSSSSTISIAYNIVDWFSWGSNTNISRAEWSATTYPIVFEPNTSTEGRTATFCIINTYNNTTRVVLDTAYVYQPGIDGDYVSTDYSADGTVATLQQSTQGKGIPVILMGDGFADKDIADSTYYRVMDKAMENLFSEEPLRSLRDYFDVYSVTCVSRNGSVGSDYSTVFSCVTDPASTNILYDEKQVLLYTDKVRNIDAEKALIIIIVNANTYHGVTTLFTNTATGKPRQQSICLCTIIDHRESETFRQVIVHEAIGHGLAKLADEYGYEKNGAITTASTKAIEWAHRNGWMLNVDITDNKNTVLWNPFIDNCHFSNENIGCYEGAYTYLTGVFRPTEESMMRGNESPFNAPSRKAIYDKVMELGEGKSASTMKDFTDFDDQHKPDRWSYTTTRGQWPWPVQRLVPPIIREFPTNR